MNRNLIAISIAAPTLEDALRRIPQARPLADLIEFRLDYLKDFSTDDPVSSVRPLIKAAERPLILTYHPGREKPSERSPDFQRQVSVWRSLFSLAERDRIYFDLDLRLAQWFQSNREPAPWDCVIASYHDFTGTPDTFSDIYESLSATPAAILKIATLAEEISDAIALFDLLGRARRENRRLIALSMGDAGVMSRILTPGWGGFLTFGSLVAAEQTAPGQLTADELRHLYRVPHITAGTRVAGIIGNPVQHSLSPLIHNTVFGRLDLDWVYVPLWVTDVDRFLRDFVNPSSRRIDWNLRGLSVTIPHKIGIIPFLDRVDSVAQEVGAVNTVVVEGGQLVGYNTDVEGALRPLRERAPLKKARAVILGAGGAAHAVAFGLAREGAQVTILARRTDRAARLAGRVGGASGLLADLADCEYDVLINATPVGLEGSGAQSLVPVEHLRPGAVVFDLIPRAEETRLLRDARAAGCVPINGLEMLVHQAARQFELWTHRSAPIDVMVQAVWPERSPAAPDRLIGRRDAV